MDALQTQVEQLLQQNETLQQQINDAPPQHNVHRVSVKLPPFWRDKPSLWFAQVEAQFALANIHQETTKYSYVIAHLDERFANEVEDIITAPPAENPFTHLKEELVRRLSISEEKRVRQLLIEEELGDRSPSQFLRHLRSLAGPTLLQDNLLRTLWLQRLPTHVQAILQTQANLPLDSLAKTADKIVEVQPSVINAVVDPPTTICANFAKADEHTRRLDEVCKQLSALQTELRFLRHRGFKPRNRDQSAGSRHRQATSPAPSSKREICWYHCRYGDKAQKCTQPCNYKMLNLPGSQ